jgi:8-oxo-dGTP pyrophosphatase MutT (NUDIX family)
MDDALPLLDELRLIAQNGLEYADDPYDRERYERVLELVAREYADAADLTPDEVHGRFADRVGHVTPNVGGRAGIVDDDGRVLVMQRAGDGTWGIPGGYTDPGETPAETAVREAREETGLDVEPEELVTFVYREPDAHNPHGFVGGVYRCSVVVGELSGSHESDELGYRHLDEVPEWHKDHGEVVRQVLESWRAAGED